MLAKWAEDERQEKIKAEQRRQKMLEHRQLCQKLDVQRHKQLIADKVCLSVSLSVSVYVSVCLSVCLCLCLCLMYVALRAISDTATV